MGGGKRNKTHFTLAKSGEKNGGEEKEAFAGKLRGPHEWKTRGVFEKKGGGLSRYQFAEFPLTKLGKKNANFVYLLGVGN